MSGKTPRIKWRKAIKALEAMGWEMVRQGKGSHAIYKHPDHPHTITAVMNKPGAIVSGTVHKGIKQQMGKEAYAEFLKRAS